jgi:glycosyltransferase involved in cell wall biosynthesis
MRFIFYSSLAFERWDYRNPDEFGIGNSETSHIEMSWRLARRGHEVISYAPIREDTQSEWRGVKWKDVKDADPTLSGIWVIYRTPGILDAFPKNPDQTVWFIAQDTHYPDMTEDRAKKIDKYFCLCEDHAAFTLKKYPYLKDKIDITSNGIRLDEMRKLPTDVQRNPKRLMWASSPDRGLKYLIQSFRRAREFIPDLELHIFYGWDNVDKMIEMGRKDLKRLKEETLKEAEGQPSIYWHGRVGQKDLWIEWLKTGIFCYQTNMAETSCCNVLESQALGAIPITNPIWGLKQNTRYGILLEGDAYNDKFVKARYVAEIIRLASNPKQQDDIRKPMMQWSPAQFHWDIWVDEWESKLYKWPCLCYNQYAFQHKYATGSVLNVGSDGDFSKFKDAGATNLDVNAVNPIKGWDSKADIIADIRHLPPLDRKWDTIVIGDVIEHMSYDDGILALRSCRSVMNDGGSVVITAPDDRRGRVDHGDGVIDAIYTEGSVPYHRPLPKEELLEMIDKAGLKVELIQDLDYGWFTGHGVVAR